MMESGLANWRDVEEESVLGHQTCVEDVEEFALLASAIEVSLGTTSIQKAERHLPVFSSVMPKKKPTPKPSTLQ